MNSYSGYLGDIAKWWGENISEDWFGIRNEAYGILQREDTLKEIVKLFQAPAVGVKFLQFAPGEFFFASVKIAAFCGVLITSPIILYQLLLYFISFYILYFLIYRI